MEQLFHLRIHCERQSDTSAVIHHRDLLVCLWNMDPYSRAGEELQKRIQSMGMRCCRILLGNSYSKHITNEGVQQNINQAVSPHDDLFSIVKKRHHPILWPCCNQDSPMRGGGAVPQSIRFDWAVSFSRWQGDKETASWVFCIVLL